MSNKFTLIKIIYQIIQIVIKIRIKNNINIRIVMKNNKILGIMNKILTIPHISSNNQNLKKLNMRMINKIYKIRKINLIYNKRMKL